MLRQLLEDFDDTTQIQTQVVNKETDGEFFRVYPMYDTTVEIYLEIHKITGDTIEDLYMAIIFMKGLRERGLVVNDIEDLRDFICDFVCLYERFLVDA